MTDLESFLAALAKGKATFMVEPGDRHGDVIFWARRKMKVAEVHVDLFINALEPGRAFSDAAARLARGIELDWEPAK